MFPIKVPGPLSSDKVDNNQGQRSFSYRLLDQKPLRTSGGTARIVDSTNFPVATDIAAGLEVEPGGMREMYWHPNTDEWQYFIEGTARMGVFASERKSRTFDYRTGDVGYVHFAMGHYIENTGDTPLRFLEMFKSPRFQDVSLNQWMALTPPELVKAHLNLNHIVLGSLRKEKWPVIKKSNIESSEYRRGA
jgi:oxalate decarboxylase